MPAANKANELHLTRIYDAPVKLVWDAWTDPKQAAKWWGPRGFTITTHSKDLRPGGHWKYTMHGPDGTDWPNNTIYFVVEECARLVYDHGGSDDRPPLFRVNVTFAELKGKTKMEMTMTMPTAEALVEAKKIVKKASGESTWDRLAEYLAEEKDGKDWFVIHRSFDAPIETVFEMWTNPAHFTRWLPPTGFTMRFLRGDLRQGSEAFFVMTNSDGAGSGTASGHTPDTTPNITMYGRTKYLEITPPGRIVYTQQFCDESERISRHPMAPLWPETMLTTVVLEAEGANRTRVQVTTEPYGQATPEERATFRGGRTSMTQGWTGSFDKLEELLST